MRPHCVVVLAPGGYDGTGLDLVQGVGDLLLGELALLYAAPSLSTTKILPLIVDQFWGAGAIHQMCR